MSALKIVKKLSVELWTLLTLDRHLLVGVAEGEGPLYQQKTTAEDIVTMVDMARLHKCKLYE